MVWESQYTVTFDDPRYEHGPVTPGYRPIELTHEELGWLFKEAAKMWEYYDEGTWTVQRALNFFAYKLEAIVEEKYSEA